MSNFQVPPLLVFGFSTLDSGRRMLQRINSSGEVSEIRLSSAETLILAYMLVNAGEVCSKELLLEIGWEGKPISPNSLTVAIANLRRHMLVVPVELEIRSIPKKGYLLSLFVPLREREDETAESKPAEAGEPQPVASHDGAVVDNRSPVNAAAEAASVVDTVVHHSRPHKWLKFFTPELRHRLLVRGNLVIAFLLIALVLLLRFEWLSVTCRVQQGVTVCVMDERHPFLPVIKKGENPADALYLVAGQYVTVLSKKQLLNAPVEEDENE